MLMYDVPGTILALFKTVNYIFEIPEGNTEDTMYAKLRALENFRENLLILINNDLTVKEVVDVVKFLKKDTNGSFIERG